MDQETREEFENVKDLIRSSSVGGLLLLMFFMSCSQCSRLNDIEAKVDRINQNIPTR